MTSEIDYSPYLASNIKCEPMRMERDLANKIYTTFQNVLTFEKLGLHGMAADAFNTPLGKVMMYGVSKARVLIELRPHPEMDPVRLGFFTVDDIVKWTGWKEKDLR